MPDSLTKIVVEADYCPVEVSPGVVRFAYRGDTLDATVQDAERLVGLGVVRLADGADASVPTGDEHSVDEGEAVGTDADEPHLDADDADEDAADEQPAALSKAELLDALEAAGVEHDRRWGVTRLTEALDASRDH